MLRYDFAGTIIAAPFETTILFGDAFSGSWIVETNQLGEIAFGPAARQYQLTRLNVSIGNDTIEADSGGRVIVSERAADARDLNFFPSGLISEYVVTYLPNPVLPRWNLEVWRASVLFGYDGFGIWNNLSLPSNFDFLNNVVLPGILIQTFGREIYGRITAVSISQIPIPPSILMLGTAIAVLSRFGGMRSNLLGIARST